MESGKESRTSLPTRARSIVRRYPVSLTLATLCVVASLAFAGEGARESVGYGLPAVLTGQWWRFGIGALVTPTLAFVPLLVGATALVVGLLEARIGSRRTAFVAVATHLAGTVGAAGVLAVGSLLPWPWAATVAVRTDVGPSAAMLGALAVLAGTLRPTARHLVVTGVGAYLVAMLFCSGLLWDLEHLLAFGAGVALAPALPGVSATSRLGRVRIGAALLVATTALAGVVQHWFPGFGGVLGSGATHQVGSLTWAGVTLLVALGTADGLRRGCRWAWRLAPVGAAIGLVAWPLGAGWSLGTVTAFVAILVLAVVHHRLAVTEAPTRTCDVRDRLRQDGGGTLGWQHTWDGNEAWTNAEGDVTIGFRRGAGVAIVVGDPIGPRFRWYAATREFVEHCRAERLVPAWYAVSTGFVRETGHEDRSVRVGEDAVVDLPGLELRGKPWQDVRTARNRAAREGVTMVRLDPRLPDPELVAKVAAVADAWADDKPLPEMGFTLGGVREALDPEVRVNVALDTEGEVHGVVSWLPVHRGGRVVGWTLDLMRRRHDGFRPVIEMLIAESLVEFRDEGYETASLSVAPLARSGGPDGVLERVLDRAGEALEPAYGFGSLLAFKQKFSPRLAPVHLAYESCLDLPRIGYAIVRAYVPHLSLAQAGSVGAVVARPAADEFRARLRSVQAWRRSSPETSATPPPAPHPGPTPSGPSSTPSSSGSPRSEPMGVRT